MRVLGRSHSSEASELCLLQAFQPPDPQTGAKQGTEINAKEEAACLGGAEAAPEVNAAFCRGHGWPGQELTLQLSALAKDGDGMGTLCWLSPNLASLAAILRLGEQRTFYQLRHTGLGLSRALARLLRDPGSGLHPQVLAMK